MVVVVVGGSSAGSSSSSVGSSAVNELEQFEQVSNSIKLYKYTSKVSNSIIFIKLSI